MNIQISAETLSPIHHNQISVITTELLADLYGTKSKNISDNYLNNTGRFVAGKHFFKLEKDALREFKNRPDNFGVVGSRARSLILWTERGAARHAKMLETDQAWEVFEKLEDSYFNQKGADTSSAPDASRKISEKQQLALRQIVDARSRVMRGIDKPKAIMSMWSALKGHFGVSYKDIPEDSFAEAISLLSGMKLRGEDELWMDAEEEEGKIPRTTRILVTIDGSGNSSTQPIDDNAFIFSASKIPDIIRDYNCLWSDDLERIVVEATRKLAQKAAVREF